MSNCCNRTLNIPIQPSDGRCVYLFQGDTVPKITLTIEVDGIDLTTSIVSLKVYNGNIPFIDITNDDGVTILSSTVLEIDKVTSNNYPIGRHEGKLLITENVGTEDEETYTYCTVRYTVSK